MNGAMQATKGALPRKSASAKLKEMARSQQRKALKTELRNAPETKTAVELSDSDEEGMPKEKKKTRS